jgi:hypothetical protein
MERHTGLAPSGSSFLPPTWARKSLCGIASTSERHISRRIFVQNVSPPSPDALATERLEANTSSQRTTLPTAPVPRNLSVSFTNRQRAP